jgi:hypothetical protein
MSECKEGNDKKDQLKVFHPKKFSLKIFIPGFFSVKATDSQTDKQATTRTSFY